MIAIITIGSIGYVEEREIKNYILALGTFYTVLHTILTTEKAGNFFTGVIGTLIVIISWTHTFTSTIKEEARNDSLAIIKNFEKKLPRIKIKGNDNEWFLLRATGNELLIMRKVGNEVIYRGVALRGTEMITEQP